MKGAAGKDGRRGGGSSGKEMDGEVVGYVEEKCTEGRGRGGGEEGGGRTYYSAILLVVPVERVSKETPQSAINPTITRLGRYEETIYRGDTCSDDLDGEEKGEK